MYGALSGEGPENDQVLNQGQQQGSGNQQHNLNPDQFDGLLDKLKGSKGAGEGAAAGEASASELALVAA